MLTVEVILPLYRPKSGWNAHVLEGVEGLRRFFDGRAEVQFTIVNDGSDLSYFPEGLLAEIGKQAGNFRFYTYTPNRGKGYSLRYAVSRSKADLILYTDGDFPFGWHGIADAFEKLANGADTVMGIRSSAYGKALSPGRRCISSVVRIMNRLILGLPDRYLDTQAGLKGFNRRGKQAFLAAKAETFLFDTEFILIAWRSGLAIETIPLSLRSGLHFSRMGTKVLARELFQFARILWENRVRKCRLPEFSE